MLAEGKTHFTFCSMFLVSFASLACVCVNAFSRFSVVSFARPSNLRLFLLFFFTIILFFGTCESVRLAVRDHPHETRSLWLKRKTFVNCSNERKKRVQLTVELIDAPRVSIERTKCCAFGVLLIETLHCFWFVRFGHCLYENMVGLMRALGWPKRLRWVNWIETPPKSDSCVFVSAWIEKSCAPSVLNRADDNIMWIVKKEENYFFFRFCLNYSFSFSAGRTVLCRDTPFDYQRVIVALRCAVCVLPHSTFTVVISSAHFVIETATP